MKYTNEQYRLMDRIKSGIIWDDLEEQEQEILRYLDDEKIAESRAYIQDGLWVLSQKGQAILQTRQDELRVREDVAKKESEEYSEQKRQQRFENKISVLNLIAPFVTFVLGVIVEHFTEITLAVWHFFTDVGAWIASLWHHM